MGKVVNMIYLVTHVTDEMLESDDVSCETIMESLKWSAETSGYTIDEAFIEEVEP